MSAAYPAYALGTLCIGGGLFGFARKRSVPSLAGGVVVGGLYLWSAVHLTQDETAGFMGALSASVLLLLSSLPRARKGPVPAVLSVASVIATYYFGSEVWERHP